MQQQRPQEDAGRALRCDRGVDALALTIAVTAAGADANASGVVSDNTDDGGVGDDTGARRTATGEETP